MTDASAAERTLFSDLTRLFMSLRQAPHQELEARLEERFREYLRVQPEVGGLQITFTWTMPDGADGWGVYATEYRTVPAERPEPQRRAVGGTAEVLMFPAATQPAPACHSGASAQIIAFPSR